MQYQEITDDPSTWPKEHEICWIIFDGERPFNEPVQAIRIDDLEFSELCQGGTLYDSDRYSRVRDKVTHYTAATPPPFSRKVAG